MSAATTTGRVGPAITGATRPTGPHKGELPSAGSAERGCVAPVRNLAGNGLESPRCSANATRQQSRRPPGTPRADVSGPVRDTPRASQRQERKGSAAGRRRNRRTKEIQGTFNESTDRCRHTFGNNRVLARNDHASEADQRRQHGILVVLATRAPTGLARGRRRFLVRVHRAFAVGTAGARAGNLIIGRRCRRAAHLAEHRRRRCHTGQLARQHDEHERDESTAD